MTPDEKLAALLPRDAFGPVVPARRVQSIPRYRPYQGRVPYLAKRTWVSMWCGYLAVNPTIVFVHQIKNPPSTSDYVINVVCRVFGVERQELLGESRVRHLTEPRQALYALLHEFTGKSIARVGRLLNRDHTSVLYGIQVVKARRDHDFLDKMRMCRDQLHHDNIDA